MSPLLKNSVTPPSSENQNGSSNVGDVDHLHLIEVFFKRLKDITSGDGAKMLRTILERNKSLEDELRLKAADSEELKKEMETKLQDKQITIREMFESNEGEASKHAATLRNMKSLAASLRQQTATIEERDRQIIDLQEELAKSETSGKRTQKSLDQAHQDILELTRQLQSKDTEIDKMKEVGSKWKSERTKLHNTVTEFRTRNEKLEQGLISSNVALKEMEGFGIGYDTENEDIL